MKVLLCHNFYQQPGGEDLVFAEEGALLEAHGHQVVRYTRHNDEINSMGRIQVACKTLYNRQTYDELSELIALHRPDVMHCTNTFPLISPAAYDAARRHRVAVVQSLHNYRLACANALFLREGKVCEDCLGKTLPWPAIRHGCYRDSRSASAVVAAMLTTHQLRKTWHRTVDRYIALTEFARNKYLECGLPGDRVVVKPNFLSTDPGLGTGQGGYAVFVGRLSPEKGLDTLLAAWPRLKRPLPLQIIGDGPQAGLLRSALPPGVTWCGRLPTADVLKIMGGASFLVMPSVWYETFGRTIIEAFARGTPVLASRLGAMAELVDDGKTGLLFAPGDANDLATKIDTLMASPAQLSALRHAARAEYQAKYTAQANYAQLLTIYEDALSGAAVETHASPV